MLFPLILKLRKLKVDYLSCSRRPGSSASNASGGSEVFMRPPSLPGKSTFAATMAAARQQQILQQYNQHHQVGAANQNISNLPDFTVSKNDMSEYNNGDYDFPPPPLPPRNPSRQHKNYRYSFH